MPPKAKAVGKAEAKAAPKAAAVVKTAAAPAPAPAPAAKKMGSVEEMKKFVMGHEMKIDDLEVKIRDEADKAQKKKFEGELKKLQKDETYLKVVADIKEAEAAAAKEAERAALSAKKDDKKGKAADKKDEKKAMPAEKANEEIMAEIDAAFAGSGKDAAAAKDGAVQRMMACASSTPFVLSRLDRLIAQFDGKGGPAAVKAACAILEAVEPKGHAVAQLAIPPILAGMEDKKWKVKAGCIEVLLPALKQMEHTKSQLAQALPLIMPKLAEAALEVRAEVRNATGAVLREIGSLVASPEIKKLSQDLVTALAEPTNQKHTQAVLERMGSQTFLSLIDPASLSLLMPVVVRGLKERDSQSKKWSVQIFGATAMLVADLDSIKPYMKSVVPMLQAALTDPVPEVQREGAKAFGILEQVLPDYSRRFSQPFLFGKLRFGELGEQIGSALALSEVFLKMNKPDQAKLIPEIELGTTEEKWQVRRGFLELVENMPHAMKMDFVPYIVKLFPRMLMGITGDKDKDEDTGLKASTSLVARFGDLCPQLLMPGFESVYAASLYGDTHEETERLLVIRDKTAQLYGKLVDKILEHKKFGQDLLTTDECSNKETREWVLVLVMLMRFDTNASVKRYANAIWRTAGGAAKLQKTIAPAVEKMLQRMRAGELGLGMQKHAPLVWDELVKTGDLEPATGEDPEPATKFKFDAVERDPNSIAARIAYGKSPEEDPLSEEDFFKRQESGGVPTEDLLRSQESFAKLPKDVLEYCNAVAASVITEGRKQKVGGPRIAENVAEQLKAALTMHDHASTLDGVDLPTISEAIVRSALGDAFDHQHAGAGDEADILLRVENLLLMYGGGKLLLKDTILEMRKNCRYGVVGQNGAGKTTLMKEIASHRIVGMPKELKCIHVDDSKLGLMSKSSLSCLEYCIKMAKEIGIEDGVAGKDTLTAVGFAASKLADPVAELSTGWRMRLTLAVNMLKHADLVLLDEPTNHLDEESVEWLGDYINSITGSSVMVISHEPKFLNKICTHIMAYVDKTLEYTEGDFHAFAAKKGLTKEQIDAMLSGNLSFDTKKKGEDEEDEDGSAPAAVAGPPKLSFPIPGTVEGVKSGSRAVLEAKNLSFRWSADKEYLIEEVGVKLSLNARIAICGRNGCGKSTLMTLLCSEMNCSENKDGSLGEIWRHCNLRLAYMKQDHLKALGPFFDTTSFNYICQRFKDGYDGDLQKRLIEPENGEEAERRAKLAKQYGKYGNQVAELISRTKNGNELAYEVRWEGLDDPKQNTVEKISKLRQMGLEKVVIACDERIAAKAAGLDQRPLTRREIVRHCEAFGIDEEMCCNQLIKGFSAGQKVRLSLAAMFWTKPHLIALDEPTNYLDVETVEALAKALTNFRGGICMIEPKTDFVEKICNEKWHLEDGKITVEKLNNGAKRAA